MKKTFESFFMKIMANSSLGTSNKMLSTLVTESSNFAMKKKIKWTCAN